MEIANIHEAKSQLSKLIEHAMNGEEVIIAKAGQPMVRLVPIHADDSPRSAASGKAASASPRISTRCPTTSPPPSGSSRHDAPRSIPTSSSGGSTIRSFYPMPPARRSATARTPSMSAPPSSGRSPSRRPSASSTPPTTWKRRWRANRFLPLPVTIPHALAVHTLPASSPRPVRPPADRPGPS